MTVSVWITGVIALISLLAGLWIGRSMKSMAEETEERVKEQEEETRERKGLKKNEKRIPLGWIVSSPVSGTLRPFYEGSRLGAVIVPLEEAIYAPVSGRVLKVYPMGKAMLIATDFGKELMIKVGNGGDDLCSMYYRSRVVQNEVISKGKLLLEFDRKGLESQGVEVVVTVTLESLMEEKNIVVTGAEQIKTGEELIWS